MLDLSLGGEARGPTWSKNPGARVQGLLMTAENLGILGIGWGNSELLIQLPFPPTYLPGNNSLTASLTGYCLLPRYPEAILPLALMITLTTNKWVLRNARN